MQKSAKDLKSDTIVATDGLKETINDT